jgi:hypothetical protein
MKFRYAPANSCRSTLKLSALLLALIAPATCLASRADDSSMQSVSVATPDTQASTASTAAVTPTTTLSGSIEKITIDLNRLNDVGRDLKHVVKSLSNIYDEATYEPATFTSEPEMVGPTIIMMPMLVRPIGMPPQPMRKEKVDLAMSEIKPVIDMLAKNVNRYVNGQVKLDLPDDIMAQVQPNLNEWVSGINDLNNMETALEGMTQAPPYNNDKIGNQVLAMEKQIKKLDESRRTIFSVVRKEGEKMIHEERKEEHH